jgi:outer membrane receptor for ferrienterochelin and colicins
MLVSYSYYEKRKKTTVKDLVTLEEFPYPEPSSQDTTRFENWMGRWMMGGRINRKMEMQSGLEFSHEDGSGKRIGGEKFMNEAAAFATLKYSIFDQMDIQAGLRYIDNSKFDAPLIYNFNTLWNINPALNLRLSYGRGFRAPSLKELYFEFIDINHHVFGNENLKAEESVYAGVNAEYTLNRKINTTLNLFQNVIDNKIDLLYNSRDIGKARYYNLSGKKTTIRGIKFLVNFEPENKLKIQAGSQLNGQSQLTSGNFSWTTDASLNILYTFQELKSRISLYYKYNGKYIFYTANYNENGTLDAVVENYLSRYHSLDVILTKWLWKDQLEVSGGIKNAFDNKNVIGRGSSGPHGGGEGPNATPVGWGRSLFFQIQLNLDYGHKI